jgi:hypothetical protein
MPIRKPAVIKGPPLSEQPRPTGGLENVLSRPVPYQAIKQPEPAPVTPTWYGNIPAISTRDLNYFFNLASSLYTEGETRSSINTSPAGGNAPPTYGEQFQETALDTSAIIVLWLFRQTRIDIYPIAERFHLGPADRQPLYSLNAQPSIRSAAEFNELIIKRRDPIHGVWHPCCTSDIEPALQLARPGSWAVAKMTLDAMPVWKKVVGGKTVLEVRGSKIGRGNTLRLTWGDRATLGPIGDAYGLWWETGVEGGMAEAFCVIENWSGFDKFPQGVIRVCFLLFS